MAAYDAVVGDMGVRHQQVIVSNSCNALILDGAAVNRGVLANDVAIADVEIGDLTTIFLVLWIFPHGSELKDPVVFSDSGRPFDDHMRTDFGAGVDSDIGADDGVGSYTDIAS